MQSAIRLGGSTEWCLQAIYHGKPIIALPFFGDQSGNADKLINKARLLIVPTFHIGAQGSNHFAVAHGAGGTAGRCCLLAAGCMCILHVTAPAQPRGGLHMLSAFCLPSAVLEQSANIAVYVQGMAVKLRLANLKASNHEMLDGITRVLTDGNFTLAAKALSAKIRSHRRTPVQQAGGERPSHHTCCLSKGHEAESAHFL